jgi:alkylhydroperoxidase family enzyme
MDRSRRGGRVSAGAPSPLARLVASVAGRVTGGEPLRVFTALGHHPGLFRAWLRFAAALMFRGDLPRVDRELVTLRTAWRCGSWYEWVHHADLARRCGLGPDDLRRVVEGPDAEDWHPRQRLLLQAADELHDRGVVTDRTWAGLTAELTDRQRVELCLLVGHYEMLAMVLNSLAVAPEPAALARLTGKATEAADRLRDRLAAARDA